MNDEWMLQEGNYSSTSDQGDEQFFVMQHMINSMTGNVLDNVSMFNMWIFGTSNQMISRREQFKDMSNLRTQKLLEIIDDTTHPIAQVGKVSLSMQDG